HADQVGAQFGDPGATAFGIGGQIERPQGADLAMPGHAFVGFDTHDGAVEDGDRFAAGPLVTALVQGQVHLVDGDFADFHSSPFWLLIGSRSGCAQSSPTRRATHWQAMTPWALWNARTVGRPG